MFYKKIIKPLLFLLDAETAHGIVFSCLKLAFAIPGVKAFVSLFYNKKHPSLERIFMGLKLKNPVGLAAGFDKDAKLYNELAAFGFGFIEIGTITQEPQEGNPKPRSFRLPKDEALINRMGFNNEGAIAAAKRLKSDLKKRRDFNMIVGGNIGKNKTTPIEDAVNDYIKCFNILFDVVDYFVVNVSSPNTPNLRELQDKKPLTELLSSLQKINLAKEKPKPLLLKIAPDLSFGQLDEIIEIIRETKIQGIVATNTSITRDRLLTDKSTVEAAGAGGLSGKPIKERSTEVIRYIAQKSNKEFIIIGVGGIHSPEDAIEKLNAGADLIQVYTGFIYEGPGIVKKINEKIIFNSQTSIEI
jgi:dihydroorotate dehydrogenase